MCGIFGTLFSSPSPERTVVHIANTILNALHHRGPDGNGWAAYSACGRLLGHTSKPFAESTPPCSLLLGHTRLKVLDLSNAASQPMLSADGRYAIVFNGEIYNYKELRQELEAQGISFHTQTDTEVLLRALACWGESCLPRLVGMFAFAFYDSHTHALLCARDAFGIKPFYWTRNQEGLHFASELPALLQMPGVTRRLNWQATFNFFAVAREGVGAETFVEGIYQLPPAHILRCNVQNGTIGTPERWWQIPLHAPLTISFDEAAEELRRLFLQSIFLHMRSDVPVGVALSGGVDSSAVTCCIRHLYPELPLHAFAYVAEEDAAISEAQWIHKAANHTNVHLHTTSPTAHFLQEYGDDVFLRLNEPFSSTGLFAQYQVHKLAKEHGVTVLLNGEGGDEVLGGYYGYSDERILSLLGQGNISGAMQFFRNTIQWPGRSAHHILLRLLKHILPQWVEPAGRRLLGKPLLPAWLNGNAIKEKQVATLLSANSGVYASPDKMRITLANALTYAGCPNLLRYGDRCASAFSLENRVPFLTIPMATFCLSLPENYLVSMKGETKSVFRKAMRSIVPNELLDRRDKIGFESPEKQWLLSSAQWVGEILDTAKHSHLLHGTEVTKLWQEMHTNKRPYNGVMWRIICYLRWKELLAIEE